MSAEGRKSPRRPAYAAKIAVVVGVVAGVVAGYVAWSTFRSGSGVAPGGRRPDRAGASPVTVPLVEVPDAASPGTESPTTEAPTEVDDGPPAGGLRERSEGPWRVPEAASRQIVEVALRPVAPSGDRSLVPGMPPPPATASCELALEGGGPVRVFDSFGRERRCRVTPADGGDAFEIVFEAVAEGFARDFTLDDGPFEVYYPAPGGKYLPRDEGENDEGENDEGEDAKGEEGEGGVSLTVYPVPPSGIRALTHPRAVADLVRKTEPVAPPKRRPRIDDCTIPFDRYDNYAAAYRAYIACPRGGRYGFAVDADDRAFVVLDGKQILVGGRPDHLPDRPFQYRTSVKLDAGLHALTFYHVQGRGALRSRLAWRPPSAAKMRVVPPSAFVSHLPARAVALERRDATACESFFSAEVTRRLVVNRDVPVTRWTLAASGPRRQDAAEDLRWVWREGERVIGRGDRLDVYVSGLGVPEAGISPWRDVTLALEGATGGAGEVARYTRRLRAKARDPLEDEEIGLQLEVASAPTFVYPHEPFEIHVRAVNDSAEPVELEAVEVRVERSPRRAVAQRLGRFTLPEVPERGRDVIARRMNRITRHVGGGECEGLERVVFLIGPPGAPAVPMAFEVLGSRERGMPDLSGRGGALLIGTGRAVGADVGGVLVPPRVTRALFVLPFDSEGELRKWGMIGSIALGRGSGKALLYGDTLASPGAVGGEGLPPRMRASLKDGGIELEARPRPKGAYPIHAACAGAEREFARARWEAIYVSLGLMDCRAGTPLREFARGVDFLIDRASVLAPGARLVIVGPPPEWTREDISARYADAAREVVVRHRVAYVDLRSFMASPGIAAVPGADCREPGPDDGVRFPYPLGPAMDAIATEVLSR